MGKYFNVNTMGSQSNSLWGDMTPDAQRTSDSITNIRNKNKINIMENQLRGMGVNPPPMVERSLLDRFGSALGITSFPIIGAQLARQKYFNANPNGSQFDLGLGAATLKGAWEGIKGANPFGEAYKPGQQTFANVLDINGWKGNTDESWHSANNLAHGAVGLAGDILTDPSTYMTFGLKALLRGTGKTLSGETIRTLAKPSVEAGIKKLAEGEGKNILSTLGQDASDDAVKQLIEKVKRQAKYDKFAKPEGITFGLPGAGKSTLVYGKTLQNIGDKLGIAPVINTALEKMGTSAFGDGLYKTFHSPAKVAFRNLLRSDPEKAVTDLAQRTAFSSWSNDLNKSYRKLQLQFAKHSSDLFEGLSEETQDYMTRIMESKGTFDKIVEDVKTGSFTFEKTPDAQQFFDTLIKSRDEIAKIVDNHKRAGELEGKLGKYTDSLKAIDDIMAHTSPEYIDLVKSGKAKNLGAFSGMSDVKIREALNEYRNMDVSDITKILTEQGFEDAHDIAIDIRGILDKSQEGISPKVRKYFMGQHDTPDVTGMNNGKPFQSDAEYKNASNAMKKLRKEAVYDNPFISQEDWVKFQEQKLEQKKLDAYNKSAHESTTQANAYNLVQKIKERGVKSNQMGREIRINKYEKEKLINGIIDMRMRSISPNDPMKATMRSNSFIDLASLPADKLVEIFDNEEKSMLGLLENSDNFELEKRIKPNQKGYAGQVDNRALNNAENQAEFDKLVEQASKSNDFESRSKYFTDSDKNIDFKTLKNQGNKIEDNFSNTTSAKNVYNMNGTQVIEKVGGQQNVKPDMILDGLRKIAKSNSKLSNYLGQFKIQLSDLDSAIEAVTGRKNIIFGNNKAANLGKRVAERILPHEFGHNLGNAVTGLLFADKNAISDWGRAMQDEGKNIFKNAKYFNYKVAHEDFAESFAKYLDNPVQFEKDYPKRFEAMQKALSDFKVPQEFDEARNVVKIDRNAESKYFRMPQTAKQHVDDMVAKISTERQKVYDELANSGLNEAEAVQKLENFNKIIENSDQFEKAFSGINPTDWIYQGVEETQKVVKDVLKHTVDLSKTENSVQVKDTLETVKKAFKDWGVTENIDQLLEEYVPHMMRDKLTDGELAKIKASGDTKYIPENVFNQKRMYDGTIHQINEKMKQVTGKDNMFETLLGRIYLNRGLAHNQFVFEKNYFDKLVGMFGEQVGEKAPMNKKMYASSQDIKKLLEKVKVAPEQMEETLKTLGLPKEFATSFKPVVEIKADALARLRDYGKDFKAFTMTDTVIADINRAGKLQFDKLTHPLLKIYDNMLNVWKVNATAINLGFHARNATSNMFQNYLDVGAEALNPKTQVEAIQLTKHMPSQGEIINGITSIAKNMQIASTYASALPKLAELTSYTNPLRVIANDLIHGDFDGSIKQLKDLSTELKSKDFGHYVKKIDKVIKDVELHKKLKNTYVKTGNKSYNLFELRDMLGKFGIAKETRFKNETRAIGEATSDNEFTNVVDAIKGGIKKTEKFNPLSQNFAPYKVGKEIGSKVEEQARIVNFLANLKRGLDPYQAAEHGDKFLFDYTDLSPVEEQVFKRIIPFYTWMRKNMPLQLEQLFENSNVYKTYFKAKREEEQMVSKQDKVDNQDKNKFAQDWWQMPFNIVGKSGKPEPTFLNPNLPLADLGKLPMPTRNFAEQMFTSASPMLKLPVELLANKNVYFNSPISRGIGDTADQPGYAPQALVEHVKALMSGKQYKAPQMSPEMRYVLRNIGSLENISKVIDAPSTRINGMSEKELALAKTIAGLSLYSYDDEKYKTWAYRDRIKQLRDLHKTALR